MVQDAVAFETHGISCTKHLGVGGHGLGQWRRFKREIRLPDALAFVAYSEQPVPVERQAFKRRPPRRESRPKGGRALQNVPRTMSSGVAESTANLRARWRKCGHELANMQQPFEKLWQRLMAFRQLGGELLRLQACVKGRIKRQKAELQVPTLSETTAECAAASKEAQLLQIESAPSLVMFS